MQDFLKKYLTNFSALQVFQILRYGVLLLTGILLLKGGLPTAELGKYEGLLFLGSLLSFFWIAGFVRSVLSVHKDYEQQETHLFFNAAFAMLVCSVLAAGVFYGVVISVPKYHLLVKYAPEFAAYIALSGPSFIIEYIYLLRNKGKAIITYGVFTFSIQLAVVTLPIFLGYGLQYSIYGLLLVAVIRVVWLLGLLGRVNEWRINPQIMAHVLKLAWPLALSALVGGSAEYIDGILVTWYFDEATFAIFRYGAKEFPLFLLVANAFSNAMVPEISKAGEDIGGALDRIKKNSSMMMHAFFPPAIALMLLSPYLYPILFKAEFEASAIIFNTYLLLLIGRLVFPQTILIGKQKMWTIFNASLFEIVLNVILSLVLLKYLGLFGLALASVIASTAEKTWLARHVWKIYKIRPAQYINIKLLILYSIVLSFVFCALIALR